MTLVERGDIRLDYPVGRYLKEYRRHDLEGITIRRLLTHTAGLVAIPTSGSINGGFPKAAAALAKLPLDFPPGQASSTATPGFSARRGRSSRGGMPLDRYVDKMIYRPLGLKDTMFNPPASVRDRIAPTEFHNGRLMIGEVHDPRGRAVGGVAGHAGLFSTAADLARLCRMLLAEGTLDGQRIMQPTTVRLMWTRSAEGNGSRALGWDMSITFSRTASLFFPPVSRRPSRLHRDLRLARSPPRARTVIVLTKRVHPSGGGADRIRELRTRVAAATSAVFFRPPLTTVAMADATAPASDTDGEVKPPPPFGPRIFPRVRTGLDVLASQNFAALAGYSIGLVTNQTGVDAAGRRILTSGWRREREAGGDLLPDTGSPAMPTKPEVLTAATPSRLPV